MPYNCVNQVVFKGTWKAKGIESPMQFSEIDLAEGEWFDYDEKVKSEVTITNMKWEITRA